MNSNSILPYIDYEALVKDPKIIIGYSDVTAILLGIYAKTDIVTYYGPAVVPSFGEFPPYSVETFNYFIDVLMEQNIPHTLPTPQFWTDEFIDWETQDRSKTSQSNHLITVHGGQVTGRLIGGNLDTMTGIWNTEYMSEIKQDDILLLEDSLKNAETTERSFALLKISGVFDKIGGLILGKHEEFDDQGTNKLPYEILVEVIGDLSFPFIADFDCCHTHPMPIGCSVSLDATAKTVTLVSEY